MVKLRLVERGLLEAAQAVEDIRIRRRKTTEDNREDDVSDDGAGFSEESQQEFITRINLYVAIHLARARDTTRDSYKESLIYQTRKDLINEFLKATMLQRCRNIDCGW